MSQEVYDLLEHFGVKGMHWGVRKEQSKDSSKSEKEGLSRNQKLAIGGVSLVVVAAGAIAAKKILGMDSSRSMSSVTKTLPKKPPSMGKIFESSSNPAQEAFAALKPQRDAHKAHLKKIVKPHEFIRWDQSTLGYVIDATRGYNPNTNTFGK